MREIPAQLFFSELAARSRSLEGRISVPYLKGIATLLLEAVCRDALAEGFAYVEAYPAGDEGLQGLAFTGPKRLYEKAGFVFTARKGSTLVMKKKIEKPEAG